MGLAVRPTQMALAPAVRAEGGTRGEHLDRIYAIVGLDGAGKTAVAREVANHLARRGRRTSVVWLRNPRLFSLGIQAIFRSAGISRTVRLGGHEDVITDLRRHPFLFHLLAWSMTFDYVFGYLQKAAFRRIALRRTIICDRFVWDLIVDLSISSGLGESFLETPEGRILLDLGLRHRTVLLVASLATLTERKPILTLDPDLNERIRLYDSLATRFGWGTVTSDAVPLAVTTAATLEWMGFPPDGSEGAR